MTGHGVLTPTGALRARWSVLMVLVAAILIGGFSVGWAAHTQAQFRCQARYNAVSQERAQALTKVAAEDRQLSTDADTAITRLITDAIKAAGDREAGQAAADRYLKESKRIAKRREELDRQRAAHPFPAPPTKACT